MRPSIVIYGSQAAPVKQMRLGALTGVFVLGCVLTSCSAKRQEVGGPSENQVAAARALGEAGGDAVVSSPEMIYTYSIGDVFERVPFVVTDDTELESSNIGVQISHVDARRVTGRLVFGDTAKWEVSFDIGENERGLRYCKIQGLPYPSGLESRSVLVYDYGTVIVGLDPKGHDSRSPFVGCISLRLVGRQLNDSKMFRRVFLAADLMVENPRLQVDYSRDSVGGRGCCGSTLSRQNACVP